MSSKKMKKSKKSRDTELIIPSGNSDQKSAPIENIFLIIMFIGVALLLLVGPFERGLFFTRELLNAQVLIFSLLIMWGLFRILRKDNRLIESPLDICLLVLLVAYLLSFLFVAVDKRAALEEVMKVANYLVIYLVVLDLCRYRLVFKQKKHFAGGFAASDNISVPPGLYLILHLILATATLITIASLVAPVIDWVYLGTYTDNRIGSPMGYANTAAAYMMASYFLTLAMASLAGKRFRVFYLMPAVLMLIGIVLTFSRGAWLMMLPLILLLILTSSPGERLRAFLYLIVTSVIAVPFAFMIDQIYRSATPVRAVLMMIVAIVLITGFGFLAEKYISQSRRKRLIIAGTVATAAIAVFLVIVLTTLFSPLYLETAPDESPRRKTIEQVIDQVVADEEYLLTFEVNAGAVDMPEDQQPGYVWGVRVLEGSSGFQRELLDYRSGITEGWEEKSITIRTSQGAERLEVHFFNRDPGTHISARSVQLSSPQQNYQLNFLFSRILPERFYDRLFSYTRDANIGLRLEFSRDALKIIRDYPLLGTGGGGWAALFYGYQEQEYHSRAVHNHFLEVWVEAGIFAFLAFLGIWVSIVVAFIFNIRKGKNPHAIWQYWTAVFLPVATLGLHSIIDWNFSLTVMGIFLFVLLGAGSSLDELKWFSIKRKSDLHKQELTWLTGLLAMVIGVFLLIVTLVLISGSRATVRSQELLDRNVVKQATIEMEKAIARDSFRAVNYHNLNAVIEEQLQRTNNPDLIPVVLSLALRAYELEPYNPIYFIRYGDLLIRYIDIDEGLSYIDRIIEVRPFFEESYREYAWPRVGIAEFLIENNMTSEAERLLDDIFAVEILMNERLGTSKPLYFYLGKAYFLRGEYSSAFNYFMAVDEDDRMYEQAQSHIEMIKGM